MTPYHLMGIECGCCDGTGKVRNPYFEVCMTEDSHPAAGGDCQICARLCISDFRDCVRGEIISCDVCGGRGRLTVYGRIVAVEPTREDEA